MAQFFLGDRPVTTWRADIHYAVRGLRRSRGFAIFAVLSLAIGIGTSTAVYALLEQLVFRPLPYHDATRLVAVWPSSARSLGELHTLAEQLRSEEAIAAYKDEGMNFTRSGTGAAERIRATRVTPGFFQVLGSTAALGQILDLSDDDTRNDGRVILSHRFWLDHYAGDPRAVGSRVTLDGSPRTVVGIMPPSFDFPSRDTQVWLPTAVYPDNSFAAWTTFGYSLMARLRPGVTARAAQVELRSAMPVLRHANPVWTPSPQVGADATVTSLADALTARIRPILLILAAAVACVLLVTYVNVTNLFIARSIARQRSVAISAALGAGTPRLMRLAILEALIVSTAGAGAGIGVAAIVLHLATGPLLSETTRLVAPGGDARIAAFVLLLTALTAVAIGVWPAVAVAHIDLRRALTDSIGARRRGRRALSVADVLIPVEIGAAVVLLITATLLIRSYWDLQQVDLGFRQEGIVTARLTPSDARFADTATRRAFVTAVTERVAEIPGVTAAAATSEAPLNGDPSGLAFRVRSQREDMHHELPVAKYHVVTPGYFTAMGIPFLRGRPFAATDRAGSPDVALVSRSLANRIWPGVDPIGHQIGYPYPSEWVTVIGVVGDIHDDSLAGEHDAVIYRPLAQTVTDAVTLIIRTQLPLAQLAPTVEAAVRSVDAGVPVSRIRRLDDVVAQSTATPRHTMILLTAFAAIALILGAIGVYGTLALWVNEHRREIGVRIALGATTRQVVTLVLTRGLAFAALGIVGGLVATVLVTRAVRSLLYGVSATDPATLGLVILILLAATVVASYVPARRAARTDPVRTLRGP
jgi:putative ABC transport system permease protein